MDHVSGLPVLIVNYWSTLRFTAESMALFMMPKQDVRSAGQLSESKETPTVSPPPKVANIGASCPQATTRSPSQHQLQQAMIISTIGLLQSVPVTVPHPVLDSTFTSNDSYFKVHFVLTVLYFSVLVVPKFTYFWAWTVIWATTSNRSVGFSAAGSGSPEKDTQFLQIHVYILQCASLPLFAQTFVLSAWPVFRANLKILNYFLQVFLQLVLFLQKVLFLHTLYITWKINKKSK